MNWTDDFIGIPHVRRGRTLENGIDCIGLYIILNRIRRSVEIPDQMYTRAAAVNTGGADENRQFYEPVMRPEEGDALLFNVNSHPIHVGYCVDARFMLHTLDENGSLLERWDVGIWHNRLEGIYRYVG